MACVAMLDETPEPEPPKKPKKNIDMLEAVRKYYDGSQPLTDRQDLVRLEMSKLPLDSISAFFGALRRVASTIAAGEGEYRRFTETMTLTESMHGIGGTSVCGGGGECETRWWSRGWKPHGAVLC